MPNRIICGEVSSPVVRDLADTGANVAPNLGLLGPEVDFAEMKKMAITLTERAATEVRRIMEEQKMDEATVLRVGVTGGGCSGFSYSLGFDNQVDEKADSKTDQHGVQIVIDRKSSLYLDGTTLDFFDGLEKRGFTFENPNATKTCGCGSSFQA